MRLILCLLSSLCLYGATALAGTLEDVKTRGTLRCGVSEGIPGFSLHDAGAGWSGLDVDLCRAIAIAVFGEEKLTPVSLQATDRFIALKEGRIDLLARNTTWTIGREVEHRILFVGVSYFDGQGFLARRASGLHSALQLERPRVCVKAGTEAQANAQDYFRRHRIAAEFETAEGFEALRHAYARGACNVVSADQSQLYALRSLLPGTTVLPEFITKEPLGPVVRADDMQWVYIVRAVLALLVNAEELRITSENVAQVAKLAERTETRAVLDLEGRLREQLGLSAGWPQTVLRAVGNYGESYERNVGKASALKMGRGQNALWDNGGLLYAPPMR